MTSASPQTPQDDVIHVGVGGTSLTCASLCGRQVAAVARTLATDWVNLRLSRLVEWMDRCLQTEVVTHSPHLMTLNT